MNGAIVLRTIGIAIALGGAIDPAITSNRSGKPNVSVLGDSVLAQRVRERLSDRFTVFRSPFPAADATIIAGDQLPVESDASTAFAVFDDRVEPTVTVVAVRSQSSAPAASRVAIEATIHTKAARGRALDVTLRAGNLVVDRVTHTVATADERTRVTLAFVPPAAGAAPLRVSASLAGVSDSARADVAVDVRDQRWAVLFFDPRPSWMSTFVRRAVERDQRFVVTSRIVTSRNVSTDAGQPPRLDDLAALKLFDAVVVGAPEALTERDVAGLDAFMRRRGGAVVLLLDHRATGPYEQLAGVSGWIVDSASRAMSILPVVGDSAGLRASELAVPARLPAAAQPIALTSGNRVDSLNRRAAVWRLPIGAGRLVVSGALDAWRYRDRDISPFEKFWQVAIADAASAAPAPVGVTVSSPALRPGEHTSVDVFVRDAALSASTSPRTIATAELRSDSAPPVALRLLPSGAVGRLHADLRAPARAGLYRLVVTADGARGETPIVVSPDATHPSSNDRDVVDAWVRARKGASLGASRLDDLPRMLTAAISPAARAETWHPMRSPWWMLPFAFVLSGEWLLRRRRGLR